MHSTEVAFSLHTQPARVRFLAFPRYFRSRDFSTAVQCRVCGECMKCLIVDQTHLELASGKLVLQKRVLLHKSNALQTKLQGFIANVSDTILLLV